MLNAIIKRQLTKAEADLGESLDYARFILETSNGAFFRFARVMGFAEYRKVLPLAPFHVARIVAARDEDCGPCVQIEINQAKKAGVEHAHLEAVLAEAPERLPEELSEVYRFAVGVVGATGEEEHLREALRVRYGDRGLVELSYAIAGPRIFPILKRSLGFAESCAAHPPRVE